MKQHTDKNQTAKLIELGFPKPNSICLSSDNDVMVRGAYSIGELIGLLPRWFKPRGGLEIVAESDGWLVMHGHDPFDPQCTKPELIDALYEYCVTLKEKEVI